MTPAEEGLLRVRPAVGPSVGALRFPAERDGAAALIGASATARELRERVLRIAQSEAHVVLISGETGTGKDLVARALHAESERAENELVVVNCSAVPDGLLEAEFFGHEAGAFTDAKRAKAGLLEVADGGTLFLDEVGELGLGLQAKLLRLLEDPIARRLGATRGKRLDVRFVAATNTDLARRADEGSFRADLYYRLGVVTLELPPLRERAEDVPHLAEHFLRQLSLRFHKTFEGFEPDALAKLAAHPWPGNVRELRNAIERVVLLEDGPRVAARDLRLGPARASSSQLTPAPPPTPSPTTPAASGPARAGASGAEPDSGGIRELELAALVRALERSAGNQSAAAKLLGVSRDTVRHWMRRHDVRVETRVLVGRPSAKS